jgi:hypothetical protein
MPKSSQKPASADQPSNQRGKSRFGTSGRPARVVLPERPPRAVDNEIVSILLGADPASLTAQPEEVQGVAPAPPVETTTALVVAEAPSHSDSGQTEAPVETELPLTADPEVSVGPAVGSQTGRANVVAAEVTADSQAPAKVVDTSLPERPEVAPTPPARARRASSSPSVRPDSGGAAPTAQGPAHGDVTVSSFEEFAERWKHGLRKGQLKICEVLYQKTYAVGQTECVTSFAELGRLSGLKMRQCFNIIAQLEALKFVERTRSAATSNKKDQGSVIRFHLYPVQ